MKNASDQALAEASLNGDHSAFRLLAGRYYALIFSIILRTVRNERTAEDLTQESFLRIYEKLSLFDASRPFKPWAVRIAVRITIRHLQKTVKDQELLSFEDNWSLPAKGNTPADKIEAQILVDECLDCLPLACRISFLLKFALGFTYEEIGELVNESPGKVKTSVYRAGLKIRSHLSERRALTSEEGKRYAE